MASDEERDELLLIRSLKLGKRYEDRAKVIILSLDSKSLDEIMVSTQMSWNGVNKWRNRCREKGMIGFRNAPALRRKRL